MPPPDSNKQPLSDKQKQLFRQWIGREPSIGSSGRS